MATEPKIYRFGAFELRPATRELYKSGIKLKLRPQAFQVLEVLARSGGQIVSRDQLRELLWGPETFVDFDQSLNTCIRELRAVLNDTTRSGRYIETVPKLGYRMVVPVECEIVTEAKHSSIDSKPRIESEWETLPPPPMSAVPRRTRRRVHWPVALTAAVLLACAIVYVRWTAFRHYPAQASRTRVMLAVLPFDNLTGDSEQDYFSDGLTEEVITQLGSLDPQRLGVIARTSVMHYKQSTAPLSQVGRELGVQYVLEGSVRREANRLLVTAQLIQLKDQTQLWSREYEREPSGILTLQAEMAHEMSDEMQGALPDVRPVSAAEAYSPKPTTEAYDLYLKGEFFWNKRTVRGFQQAIEYFQQAIDKDPQYARAYVGLADSYALLGEYSAAPETEFMPKAREAALHALRLDDSLPEAHTALALVVQNYDWDWETSDREFRRAIELNPNYATAHHWYAEHLMWEGRFDEALAESERARELDPLSLIIAADNGAILYYARQYDRAIAQFQKVLAMDPSFPRAYLIVNAYAQQGRYADALANLGNISHVSGEQPFVFSERAFLYGRLGNVEQAHVALRQLEQMRARNQVDAETILLAYMGLGDKEHALECLGDAYAQHSTTISALKVEPAYDPLRGDPRFQDLLHRVNLDR